MPRVPGYDDPGPFLASYTDCTIIAGEVIDNARKQGTRLEQASMQHFWLVLENRFKRPIVNRSLPTIVLPEPNLYHGNLG